MRKIPLTEIIFYLIGLFFIIIVVWANFAELDQVVRAEASVEPPKKVQLVQSRYPGTIDKINAEVGDQVSKGDVLVVLDKEETQILITSIRQKIDLIIEEKSAFQPLVDAGMEPKIKIINMKQQMVDAQEKLFRYELQLKNSDIKAPTGGIITAVHITGEGTVLKGGETLMEVVPNADYFIVKAKILSKDIGKVSVGQKTRVSYTAYDFSRYGIMEGVVTKIAHNTTITEQGEIYYEAWVRTDGDKFSKSGIKPNILPGMLAQIDLLGEKRTVIEYIFAPLNRVASRALTEQ